MLAASMGCGRGHGESRFYYPPKGTRNHNGYHWSRRNGSESVSVSFETVAIGKGEVLDDREPENRVRCEEGCTAKAIMSGSCDSVGVKTVATPSNLERFLEATTPSVSAQYLSKTTMKGMRTCSVEFRSFFSLLDLWEFFKEWSAYGTGVPLVLSGTDTVVQYYVPYLSAIQLYAESSRPPVAPRRPGDDSDGDTYIDSSTDGSSDSEPDRNIKYPSEWSQHHAVNASILGMNVLSLGENHTGLLEYSSDDSETGNSRDRLLFEYFEQDIPYSRVPLADKISDLACHFHGLKSLRSCDLSSSSWMSVAWYPIYRIPTGPTLRDLDACFLTFHSLSTPSGDDDQSPGPNVTHPQGIESVPEISLRAFGLASYKLKGSIWASNGGCKRQSLLQAADKWIRQCRAHHPDYHFFASQNAFRR